MFDPNEVKQLEKLFKQSEERMVGKIGESEERMVGKIGESEERMVGKIGESEERMVGLIDNSIKNSEERMVGKIDSSEKRMIGLIEKSIKESEKRINLKVDQLGVDIGEVIDNTILPMIAEKADKQDIERLERKLDKVIDKVAEHDVDLRKIKSQVFVS